MNNFINWTDVRKFNMYCLNFWMQLIATATQPMHYTWTNRAYFYGPLAFDRTPISIPSIWTSITAHRSEKSCTPKWSTCFHSGHTSTHAQRSSYILTYPNFSLSDTCCYVWTSFRIFTIRPRLKYASGQRSTTFVFCIISDVLPNDDTFSVETCRTN